MPLRTGELPRMTFTVVIPVKNGAATLDRCLSSIWESAAEAGLDDGRVEIMVVDNGSVDGSADLVPGQMVIYSIGVFNDGAQDGAGR